MLYLYAFAAGIVVGAIGSAALSRLLAVAWGPPPPPLPTWGDD